MAIRNLFFVFITLLLSCSSDDDSSDKVLIRISNKSEVIFNETTFNSENFGALEPNQRSEYRVFEGAYEIGSLKIIVNGETYLWLPSDFIGETLLSSGKYTFEYIFDVQTKTLTDKVIRD